jgi:spore germination protein YaaH
VHPYVFALIAAASPEPVVVDSAHQAALRGEIADTFTPSAVPSAPPTRAADGRVKTGVVYGYFPAGYTIDKIKGWDQLTHIVWFGPTISSSGTMSNTAGLGGATYAQLRTETRNRGIQLVIGLINFNTSASPSSVSTLLSNKATAVATIKKLVSDNDADGASLDFEVVPEASKAAYVDFLASLSAELKADNPNASLSSAIPPPTGWKGYDYVGILQNSDLAFVMAYDYHWQAAPTAGPVTPKNDGTMWGSLNLTTSLNSLDTTVGDLKTKLVIGLPWYGYSWPTTGTSVPSSTASRPDHPTFAPTCASGKSQITGGSRSYDMASEQPYSIYSDAEGPRQMWLDDADSFAAKMDLVKAHGFGGVGMFQLGYEGDDPAFWTAIADRYSAAPSAPTADISAPTQGAVGQAIPLDGSGSSDPQGQALTYAWTSDSGTIADPTAAQTTITATTAGVVTVHLVVSNATTQSAPLDRQIQIVAGAAPTGPTGTTAGTGTPGQTNAQNGTTDGGAATDAAGRQSSLVFRGPQVKSGCASTGSDVFLGWLLLFAMARRRRVRARDQS